MDDTTQPAIHTIRYGKVSVPTFFYGTAWKEALTEALTKLALEAGFRGIDTANQPRHYNEAGVGAAIEKVLMQGTLQRSELFIQTKFTYPAGQDHRIPYDAAAAPSQQVEQSLASSLAHLHIDYLDALILHSPSVPYGWRDTDWQVWRTMEALQQAGKVRLIGISNIDRKQLAWLVRKARIKPAIVQNRCFAKSLWDKAVRSLCRSLGIVYQGFSLLTANVQALNHPSLAQIARRRACTPAHLVFRFALQAGMVALTGTTDANHMREDLGAYETALDDEEMETIEYIASPFHQRHPEAIDISV